MSERTNREFPLRGVNHIALVCRDMARTVDFYCNTLGMPMIKTLNIPGGGQHFFFDAGNDTSVAFFWFPDAPDAIPGVTGAHPKGGISAVASMNHLAFDVAPEHIEACVKRLREKGVTVTDVVNHDDTPRTVSATVNETTFVRSIYFSDPDGIRLEMAAWVRPFTEADRRDLPNNAEGRPVGELVDA